MFTWQTVSLLISLRAGFMHTKTERREEDDTLQKKCFKKLFCSPVSHILHDIFWI